MLDKVIALYEGAPRTQFLIGSGAFVSDKGLVFTANHVIKKEGHVLPKIFASFLKNEQPVPLELEFIKSISERDLAVLEIKNCPKNISPPFPYFNLCENIEQVSSCDEVMVCGFPGAFHDKQGNPLPSSFPMLRKGIVSSLYEKIGQHKVIILDFLGVKGFSGSPIFHLKTKKVIGIFSQIPGAEKNTGFSLAYPISLRDLKDYK